tara:strand:- start:612 stop:1967 length:1356 start_codon:yes stop_codon:yes gene_type:complete
MVDSSNNPLQRGLENIQAPFSKFIRAQTSSSIFMLVAAIAALWWANSAYSSFYQNLLATHLGIFFEEIKLEASLKHIVNDGLMVLFFFLIGLEIKRELLSGDLAKPASRYMLILCALGGMLCPAAIYLVINWSLDSKMGWGIPMATDAAFALGALALMKKRLPASLFAFVVGLAIVDDIGAILVIAFFYTQEINLFYLMFSLVLIMSLGLANYANIQHPLVYIIIGIPASWLMYQSGVHPTFAGILIAMTVPASPKKSAMKMLAKAKEKIDEIQKSDEAIDPLGSRQHHKKLVAVRDYSESASVPLRRWEDALDLPISLLVLPLFALLNAGLPLSLDTLAESVKSPIGMGILGGLIFGKVLGVSGACWIALHFKIGELPEGLNFKYVLGASFITGIGFTMSTFISTLGFDAQPAYLQLAKTAIIVASIIAAFMGLMILWFISRNEKDTETH